MWFRNILRPKKLTKSPRPGVGTARNVDVQLSSQALKQLERLRLGDSRDLFGEAVGQRRSSRRKPDIYFREHRMYVPGDDLRFVDWRASARHESVFLKQGEQTKEAVVYLLLDCSASMAWGNPAKNIVQLQLAAALGYLALARGDRLYIHPIGGYDNTHLGYLRGKGQTINLVNYLRNLTFGGEVALLDGVRTFSRTITLDGVLFILSDLIGVEDLDKLLGYFPAPVWDVAMFHILHPEEINPQLEGPVQMIDSENGLTGNFNISKKALQEYVQRIEKWRRYQELTCVENHTFYTMIPANWNLEREVLGHLRERRVVRSL
jgi:hypothetical protein